MLSSAVTLKDIARLSGYSVSTVSKALNDMPDINSKTKQNIKLLADAHNYIPNNHAVALRKQKTKMVAVILPSINESFYSCFLHYIEKVARKHNYRIIIFQSFEEGTIEDDCLRSITDGSTDGAFILSSTFRPVYKSYENFPVVHIDRVVSDDMKVLKHYCIDKFEMLLQQINFA